MRFKFFKQALVITLVLAALLVYPLMAWMAPEVQRAFIAAGIIALVNVLAGVAIIEFAIDKPNGVFLASVFGGMALRMIGILATFTLLVLNGYDRMALTFALMGFYLIFMIAEFIYIMREMTRRKMRSRTQSRSSFKSSVSRRVAVADHRST